MLKLLTVGYKTVFITEHPIQFSFIRKTNQRILQLVNKRKVPTLTGLLAIPIPIEIFRFKLLTIHLSI